MLVETRNLNTEYFFKSQKNTRYHNVKLWLNPGVHFCIFIHFYSFLRNENKCYKQGLSNVGCIPKSNFLFFLITEKIVRNDIKRVLLFTPISELEAH
jgi:hypothetical protein